MIAVAGSRGADTGRAPTVMEETIPRAIDRIDASPEPSARLDGLDKPAFHNEFLALSKKNDPIA